MRSTLLVQIAERAQGLELGRTEGPYARRRFRPQVHEKPLQRLAVGRRPDRLRGGEVARFPGIGHAS